MFNKTINGLKLLYFFFFRNAEKLNSDKLEALLRARVHAIEKHGNIEETTDFASMIWGRQMYHEAKKRNLLSKEELEWCEQVLFGRQIIKSSHSISEIQEDNLNTVIKNRRSIRSWQEGELTENEFKVLIDAARWAPSSSHRQSWHFLLTRDKEKIKLLSEIRGQKFVRNAPNCIIALINLHAYDGIEINYTPYLDAGAAIQNLLLMAHSIGYGACWVNFGEKEIPDKKKMNKIKELFGIPANIKIVSIIPIGKLPLTTPNAPGRKNTTDIMHVERFKPVKHEKNE